MVWVAKDNYSVEGLDFSLRSTDEEFLELVRGYLRPALVEEGPDDINFQADCGTRRTLAGGRVLRSTANLYLGRLRIYCGPRWEDMAGRLISGVRDMVTTRSNEFVRLRAAGVVIDGKALILPSAPNPHLPALSALLARSGAGYLGDEVVNLDPILRRIHGVPLPILVDVSDLGYFPEVNGRARQSRESGEGSDRPDSRTPRRPIPVQQLGGHLGSPTELGWILFPAFRPGETTRVEPVANAEGVFRLMEAMLNAHIWADRALILARDLVETVPMRRLVIGSLPEAADLLTGLPEATLR